MPGVPRIATHKDIKKAYFAEAKKHHPDLNPNDPKAKIRFQKLAEAYEILGDEEKRSHYDMFGSQAQQQSRSGGHYQQQYQYTASGRSAEDIFRNSFQDGEMIYEELKSYSQELQQEFTYASENIMRGNWQEAFEVAKSHKVLLAGIVLPIIVLTRSPAAFMFGVRIAYTGSQLFISALVMTGNLDYAAMWLWNRVVAMARDRRNRKQQSR